MAAEELLKDVQRYFGAEICRFKPHQEAIIRSLLEGRDTLLVSPTGGGKSLCYQYAAAKLPHLTIVVEPLISLIDDQTKNLQALQDKGYEPIPTAYFHSGMQNRREVMEGIASGKYKLLYLSPEYLVQPKFQRFLRTIKVSLFVLDEAHCLSLWGLDFRPPYRQISQMYLEHFQPAQRPTVAAFTATAPKYIREDLICQLQFRKGYQVFGADSLLDRDIFLRKHLELSIRHFRRASSKYHALYQFLKGHRGESGIIYCTTTDRVDKVYAALRKGFFNPARYHGKMRMKDREAEQAKFMSGECPVMVATSAFGMGIDKRDIRYVIHFELPKSPEDYYQESGRAGRDGKPSACVLYYAGEEDWKAVLPMIQAQNGAGKKWENLRSLRWIQLGRMRVYAENANNLDSRGLAAELAAYMLEGPSDWSVHRVIETAVPPVLYTNESKLAQMLRKGDYEPHVPVSVSLVKHGSCTCTLSHRLSYFDMMVADAVYTLMFWSYCVIYPKNILQILSGDHEALLTKENREKILDSLARMSEATISIQCGRESYNGKFLSAAPHGKTGFCITEPPPLYRYTEEAAGGQFFTIKNEMLRITVNEEKTQFAQMANSLENLQLRHFLARRVLLAGRYQGGEDQYCVNPKICFWGQSAGRKGMFDILDLHRLENPYWEKRKEQLFLHKVQQILSYYKDQEIIKNYVFCGREPDGKEVELPDSKKVDSVKLRCFLSWRNNKNDFLQKVDE